MQENKEFEDKMLFEKWYGDFQKQQGERRITVKDMFEAYKAALQSEREKHRWIPVTERLPEEKDGKAEIDAQLGKYVKIFGVERESCIAREGIFFINGKRNLDTIWFTKWQPLPEV